MGCAYERKRLAGLTVRDVLRPETISPYNCIFICIVRISVFDRSPVAHDLILPNVCARGHIPDGFWVVWEGPPIAHTHLATVPNVVAERG